MSIQMLTRRCPPTFVVRLRQQTTRFGRTAPPLLTYRQARHTTLPAIGPGDHMRSLILGPCKSSKTDDICFGAGANANAQDKTRHTDSTAGNHHRHPTATALSFSFRLANLSTHTRTHTYAVYVCTVVTHQKTLATCPKRATYRSEHPSPTPAPVHRSGAPQTHPRHPHTS